MVALFWLAVAGAVASYLGGPEHLLGLIADRWMWIGGVAVAWWVFQQVMMSRGRTKAEALLRERWGLLTPECQAAVLRLNIGPEGSPERKLIPESLRAELFDQLVDHVMHGLERGLMFTAPYLVLLDEISRHARAAPRIERQVTVSGFAAFVRECDARQGSRPEGNDISPDAPEASPAAP